jgi:hypothetical protein
MRKLFIILLLIAPLLSTAQIPVFQKEQYPFPLTFNGIEPQLGFSNAGAYYHHDFGDLDNDGDADIVTSCGGATEYYIKNIGTPQQAQFQAIPYQIVTPFSGYMFQSPSFCDIDADGDLDIFITGFDGYIIFYENIGTPNNYEYILADSSFEDIDIIEGCVLDFVDSDGDSDYDLFVGGGYGPNGGKIYYYENIGNTISCNFTLVTNSFNNIDVGENAAPEFCDIDNDGDYDLFIGCNNGSIWYYENTGTPTNPDFVYITNNYFNIDVGNMSVPRFVYIDGDGDYDLFVGNESDGQTPLPEGDIVFYENMGTSSIPNFQLRTRQYLFPDIGECASPYAVDIDNDSLLEILVGSTSAGVKSFRNSGTPESPSYYFVDSIYPGLNIGYQPTLSFGDLDNDGDLDMIATEYGFWWEVDRFENVGNSAHPIFSYVNTIATGENWGGGGPDLVDIDGDSDLDLFFGDGLGRLEYYENVGNNSNPRFELATESYLSLPVSGQWYPRFADMDGDEDYDLIVGYGIGSGLPSGILYWLNNGTATEARFILADTIDYFANGMVGSLRPTLSDIDNDNDLDMIVGEAGGGMLFYRNMEFENSMQTTVTISLSGNDVILHWNAIEGAEEYKIYSSPIPYFTPQGEPQAIVTAPDTSWIDTNALNQEHKYYKTIVSTN